MRRCKPCWQTYVNGNIANCVVNPKEQRNLARAMGGSKRPRERSQSNGTTNSRKKIVKCKWCGSTSHKTRRSKECPYNGTTLTSPPSTETPGVDPPTAETDGVDPSPAETETAVALPKFHTGDTVLSLWSRRKWIVAHVTGFSAGKYSVYFPDSGIVRNAVPPEKVKEYKVSRNGLPVPRRGDMINKTFYDDGVGNKDEARIPEGIWLVRRIDGNEYVCLRSPDCRNKDALPNCMNFDIGYVMGQISHDEQNSSY